MQGRCPAAHSPASPNHTIAMSCVQCSAVPLGWAAHPRLPITSRMLKKSASGVLASFRSSTGTRPPHHSAARTDLVLLIRRTVRPRGYASGPSLAAALLDGLFEHPE